MKKNENEKSKVKNFKKIKIRNLLILVFLLMFNSFAWFVFTTKVDTSFQTHVTSWNIEFDAGEDTFNNGQLHVDVENAYPGMEDYEKIITVHNTGEARAQLEYEIRELRIFDKTYKVTETFTEADLLKKLEEEYPFKLEFIVENDGIIPLDGIGQFEFRLSWPFESGKDDQDTFWGEEAYKFAQTANRGISLYVHMRAVQLQE